MARPKSTKPSSSRRSTKRAEDGCDVMVIGAHPCAAFAATLLARSGAKVTQVRLPDEKLVDRLLMINPAMFDLDTGLAGLAEKVDAVPTFGLRYLADDASVSGEFAAKSVQTYIAPMRAIVSELDQLAVASGVQIESNVQVEFGVRSEEGVVVRLGASRTMHPKMLIVAADLPAADQRALGLGDHADEAELFRYSFIRCKGERGIEFGDKALIPMSLDLAGQLVWAWLLPGKTSVQFAVLQSKEQAAQLPPAMAMQRWLDTLVGHKILPKKNAPDLTGLQTIDLPLAGALPREAVGNRTLLIGPAGGFYSACAEELYPAVWSALFAADVARKALKEKHLQDALQAYRQKWGATLGDYLRGPQQNLRFLLPLIYRNPAMAARMGETILSGKGLVR